MKKVALIAHDGKKAELVSFVLQNRHYIENITIYATGTTGKHIENAGFKVKRLLSGPLGGDAQIATMVAEKNMDMVIFFRERLCDVHNVPLATNPASAALFLKGTSQE